MPAARATEDTDIDFLVIPGEDPGSMAGNGTMDPRAFRGGEAASVSSVSHGELKAAEAKVAVLSSASRHF